MLILFLILIVLALVILTRTSPSFPRLIPML